MKGKIADGGGINLPPLDQEDGTSFGWNERMFLGFRDGDVFDYSDWEARDIYEMMKRDYKSRQLESVLSLPIVSATHSIVPSKNDAGEAEWLTDYWDHDQFNGGCDTGLDQIVGLMTSGITYARAFFELVWTRGTGDFDNNIVLDKVAFRPATTCRLLRDANNGSFKGFEQEPYYIGKEITKGKFPIVIPKKRAFVYIHNQRRDPLFGASDMEIPYWCYKTKQKLLYLWFQFLEGVSLPRTIVQSQDIGVAKQVAQQVARLKSSGILPLSGDAASVNIHTLDLSGKGADQFQQAITWLDTAATNSVLAGFLDLTGAAANGLRGGFGGGSYALSKDASDYFLQALESKCHEMEFAIRRDLFAPLIRYNKGKDAKIPMFKFEPLNDEDKATSVSLLQATLTAPSNKAGIPPEFVSALAKQVGDYIGVDGDKMAAAFDKAAKDATAMAAQQGAGVLGQTVAGVAGAVGAASSTVQQATQPAPQNNPFQVN